MLPHDESAEPGDAPQAPAVEPQSADRRRLLRGSLAAAPVLMTVISRPVLGQTVCLSPSASTSIQPSGTQTGAACSGLTPEQWKAKASRWPAPYYATTSQSLGGHQATCYHCPTTGLGGHVYGEMTMMQVIDFTQGGRDMTALGRYIVAALLNARAGRTPVLNETGVRNMWNDLINRGYYEPTAGIRWTSTQIVAYLQTTMT